MGFPKLGVPQNGGFVRENTIKLDDLGVPPFQETSIFPYIDIYIIYYDNYVWSLDTLTYCMTKTWPSLPGPLLKLLPGRPHLRTPDSSRTQTTDLRSKTSNSGETNIQGPVSSPQKSLKSQQSKHPVWEFISISWWIHWFMTKSRSTEYWVVNNQAKIAKTMNMLSQNKIIFGKIWNSFTPTICVDNL